MLVLELLVVSSKGSLFRRLGTHYDFARFLVKGNHLPFLLGLSFLLILLRLSFLLFFLAFLLWFFLSLRLLLRSSVFGFEFGYFVLLRFACLFEVLIQWKPFRRDVLQDLVIRQLRGKDLNQSLDFVPAFGEIGLV